MDPESEGELITYMEAADADEKPCTWPKKHAAPEGRIAHVAVLYRTNFCPVS